MIKTPRLLLRLHDEPDFPECSSLWANPEVVRYISGTPSTAPQAWARMLAYRGHWVLRGYGYWVVTLQSTGEVLGEAGFADFKRQTEPPIELAPEMGWAFHPKFYGQGFATEAGLAMLDWARTRKLAPEIKAVIHPRNDASIRLAARLGFAHVRSLTVNEQASELFIWKMASPRGFEPRLPP